MDTSKLSKREKTLWNKIRNKSGVLMAYGIPGISKSATFASVAKKLGLVYIDLRLSTMDETDLGVYPHKEMGPNNVPIVRHSIPEWAMIANGAPTLIHFEELNRCGQNIRNAALGILLERNIGPFFELNENVYMVASGNPVTDNDNDVFVLGSALINRLIVTKFKLTYEEWVNEFAKEHGINHTVMQFLNENNHYFGNEWAEIKNYVKIDGEIPQQYPSPRSWTFFSDYLNSFEDDAERETEMLDPDSVSEFLGETVAAKWIQEVRKYFNVKLEHVLNGTINTKVDDVTVMRLLSDFEEKYVQLHALDDMQFENFCNFFISNLTMEQRAGFISKLVYGGHVIQNVADLENKNVKFCKIGDHKTILKKIYSTMSKTK